MGLIRTSRLVILYCHDVGYVDNAMCLRPDLLQRHMRALADQGWRSVPLIEALKGGLAGASHPQARLFVLCFDDGFQGVFDHAFPILSDLGFRATVYAVTRLLGERPSWTGTEGYVAAGRMPTLMDTSTLRVLAQAGWEIGAHGLDHRSLPVLSPMQQERQIAGSKAELEDILGLPVTTFCYPYGAFDVATKRIVEVAGYRAACTIMLGHVTEHSDRFTLPRLHLDNAVSRRRLLFMVSPLFPAYRRISEKIKGPPELPPGYEA